MKNLLIVSQKLQRNEQFYEYMLGKGIEVKWTEKLSQEPSFDTLVATDIPEVYAEYTNVVVIINNMEEADWFSNAEYLLLDIYDAEAEYFERVWQRFKNIPWVISETERLIIRETIEDDVDRFYELYKNPLMTEYTEKLYEDINEEKRYVSEYRKKVYSVQGFGIWTVILKETGEIIGRAGLITRGGHDGVEVGFAIGVEYWHKGYATEAVKECVSLAKLLSFDEAYALTMHENTAAIKLLSGLGFGKELTERLNGAEYECWKINL